MQGTDLPVSAEPRARVVRRAWPGAVVEAAGWLVRAVVAQALPVGAPLPVVRLQHRVVPAVMGERPAPGRVAQERAMAARARAPEEARGLTRRQTATRTAAVTQISATTR